MYSLLDNIAYIKAFCIFIKQIYINYFGVKDIKENNTHKKLVYWKVWQLYGHWVSYTFSKLNVKCSSL